MFSQTLEYSLRSPADPPQRRPPATPPSWQRASLMPLGGRRSPGGSPLQLRRASCAGSVFAEPLTRPQLPWPLSSRPAKLLAPLVAVEAAIDRLVRHRHAFADTAFAWWITPAQATRLADCSRQEIHRLIAGGVLGSRSVADAAGHELVRVNGADLVSVLEARPRKWYFAALAAVTLEAISAQ